MSPPFQPPPGGPAPRPAQPWVICAAHWANAVLLVVLAGSGLQILAAYPFLGARGATYRWYPLQGAEPPHALMLTNAPVAGVEKSPGQAGTGSTMTNATVQGVQKGGGGETLALEYKGGKKTVLVPAGTPVVKMEPGDRALLAPGAHVFVIASREQDGSLLAKRNVAGKDVEPPM